MNADLFGAVAIILTASLFVLKRLAALTGEIAAFRVEVVQRLTVVETVLKLRSHPRSSDHD